MAKTLLTNPTRTRFFLVPDAVELPVGPFEVSDVIGRKHQHVDEAALLAHEVERSKAHAYLKSIATDGIDAIGGELKSIVQQWRVGRAPPPWSETAKRESPRLALIADLSGRDIETLQNDAEALVDALGSLGRDLATLVDESVRGDNEAMEEARKRARVLQVKLQEHGIDVQGELDTWPDRLRRFVEADEAVDLAKSGADALDRAAEQIQRLLGGVSDRIRDAADRVEPSDTTK